MFLKQRYIVLLTLHKKKLKGDLELLLQRIIFSNSLKQDLDIA